MPNRSLSSTPPTYWMASSTRPPNTCCSLPSSPDQGPSCIEVRPNDWTPALTQFVLRCLAERKLSISDTTTAVAYEKGFSTHDVWIQTIKFFGRSVDTWDDETTVCSRNIYIVSEHWSQDFVKYVYDQLASGEDMQAIEYWVIGWSNFHLTKNDMWFLGVIRTQGLRALNSVTWI
ncbi:hypothetical protein L228DRAFT_264452 [Xylona heveae TC161]|uniref:Uncharacterized protein n=1 Tax=Xylona heveae (strain CBS 132557 / TC161) TaxID=1328760 RepID=A0A165JBL5_XYLHT|nr:hypothetical protein L228DRAFT_264452 [Xylona heveae TC161]KZF26016.1 hypothetical protein L228DRAFT_264452 [Xylona heveae TC161]